jgi:hypothetical protein
MSLSVFIAVGLLALPSAQQSSASPGADAPVKPQVTAPAPALNPDELPVSYGGMTHQEFLDLVTPDYAKGYAAFSNTQGLVVAATSIALKWAVLKAIDKFKDARDTRAQEEAKKEVREALEALRQARRAAGLPDK